jgi:5'-nucleotidase
MTPIIAVDIDCVLADLIPPWLEWYNAEYSDKLKPQDITAWDLSRFTKPETGQRVFDWLYFRNIYKIVPVIPGALEGVDMLRTLGRVVYVTTEVPGQCGRKFDWLKQHGFEPSFKDYLETPDKSLVRYDVMIDDGIHNFSGDGLRVLFDQPWNHQAEGYDYRMLLGWADPYGLEREIKAWI